MPTAVYFFTTLDVCCLFLIVIWTSMFVFFTTLDGCCLLLIVMWPSLFIFFQLQMGVVCFLIVIWASPVFFYNSGWVLFGSFNKRCRTVASLGSLFPRSSPLRFRLALAFWLARVRARVGASVAELVALSAISLSHG